MGNFIETFVTLVSNEFRIINKDIPFTNKITYDEKQALEALSMNDNIIIKRADKGGGVVILNKNDSVTEAKILPENG